MVLNRGVSIGRLKITKTKKTLQKRPYLTNHLKRKQHNELQLNPDITKCQGTGEWGLVISGAFLYISLLLG